MGPLGKEGQVKQATASCARVYRKSYASWLIITKPFHLEFSGLDSLCVVPLGCIHLISYSVFNEIIFYAFFLCLPLKKILIDEPEKMNSSLTLLVR